LAVTLSIRMSNVIGFTSDQGFDYPNWGFSWFSSVSPCKWRE
jgi:hypothetical protein